VSLHAVDRFRERILPLYHPWSNADITAFMRRVMRWHRPEAILTWSKGRKYREWRYFFRAMYNGERAYIITDASGTTAVTVLTEEMFLRWHIFAWAVAQPLTAQDREKYKNRMFTPTRKWLVS
jgi:hypothetical protein